ncbi:MAG: GlsB/YeaQ/YmgE family stress response membrane protein [Anaerolineae bacterium]|nr:GlsB/YeaQ/YmgE family stress response membrane protein [Gloeobacterales cyanobacterium ES-bin-313]
MSILSFLLFLVVAAVCAGIAEAIFPGRIPGGFLTTAVVGIIGGWVGASLFGSIGPALFGVTLIPTILGTGVLVFVLSLISGAFAR